MSWFSRCSWCGGPFNGGNCRQCTNVSFGGDFVRNPDPISNDETPDFSYPPSQPQTSSFNQFHCFHCGDPLEDGVRCQRCTCERCRYYLGEGFCSFCNSEAGNSFVYDSNPNSFNDPPNIFTRLAQPQYESYSCELYGTNSHYGYDCPPQFPLYSIDHQENLNQQRISDVHDRWDKIEESKNELLNMVQSFCEMVIQQKQAANIDQSPPQEMSIQDMEDLKQHYLDEMQSIRDEDLSIIPEKESDEVIKSSVEDLVPIPSESEDTSGSDSEFDLPSCNDFSPINISEKKSVTFSNPLFDSNDDFTSTDDESLFDEDVPKDNVKIYSNPLFEFDNEYISSDVNPIFDEVLEDIESKDSYVSKLDEPDLLVVLTQGDILLLEKLLNDDPLSPLPMKEFNFKELKVIKSDVSTDFEDDYYDSEGYIIYLKRLLIKDTIPNLPPDVFLDCDPRSLKDEPDKDDLKYIVKVFDPEIHEKTFCPTYVKLPFKDRHYLYLTYVIRIFLPYFTYPVEYPFLLSSRSEDTIFDPDISAFHFSSLELVASHQSGTFMIAPDFKDSRARGFVHRSLDLQSLACFYIGIRYLVIF
ncbi:hypothetical protein Tco_1427624 [Tanacetum coccineum]